MYSERVPKSLRPYDHTIATGECIANYSRWLIHCHPHATTGRCTYRLEQSLQVKGCPPSRQESSHLARRYHLEVGCECCGEPTLSDVHIHGSTLPSSPACRTMSPSETVSSESSSAVNSQSTRNNALVAIVHNRYVAVLYQVFATFVNSNKNGNKVSISSPHERVTNASI